MKVDLRLRLLALLLFILEPLLLLRSWKAQLSVILNDHGKNGILSVIGKRNLKKWTKFVTI